MKKIKILVFLVTLLSVSFYSCTDNNSVENEVEAKKSLSLRTVLNQIKKTENVAGRSAQDNEVCFEFVFPFSVSYNNGTVVEVTSYEGLLNLLETETGDLYIEGIVFPFQVLSNGETVTVNNEDDFFALIELCDFETIDQEVTTTTSCFDMVYPFSVINQDNETVVVNNGDEFFNLFSENTYILDFVYPLVVSLNGENVTVDSMYELLELADQCDVVEPDGCVCPEISDPVCVNIGNGDVVVFSNMCFAECAGFTSADVVDCSTYSCNCPSEIDVVCVATPTGEIIEFINPCYAECAGYTPGDFVNCN